MSGAAELHCTDLRCIRTYGIQPHDFVGLTPRLEIHEGDHIEAGQTLITDKNNARIRLTSPVCGTVKEIRRGKRRLVEAVVVEQEGKQTVWKCDPADLRSRNGLIEAMTACGLWAMMRQRPFGIIANPDDAPRDIFVSLFDTAPLAPDLGFADRQLVVDNEQFLAAGLNALGLLTDGKVHVGISARQASYRSLADSNAVFHEFSGPHPAGNVGTQIAAIAPLNKGERVWTMNPQDIVTLGRLFATGEYQPERCVAVCGPAAAHPQYCHIKAGASLGELLQGQISSREYPKLTDCRQQTTVSGTRIISGNVLSGLTSTTDDFVGAYDSQVTLIEEGDNYDFMGWFMPGLRKHSFSRTFLSGVLAKPAARFHLHPWRFDTNLHGGERPLVFSGDFERVFPFDIYPTQLLKAAIIGDIDLMEQLGIYEVEPEDFALCEYIDPSKTEIQSIIRSALEQCRKESI